MRHEKVLQVAFALNLQTAYPPIVTTALRQHLQQAGLDHDAINVIVRVGNRADMPASLASQWCDLWDDQRLLGLVALSPGDRQHTLAAQVESFLQDPANCLARARHAATQTRDDDLRVVGELALELADVLVAFGRDVTKPMTSPFTGKVKYASLTDLDIVTTKAIIEVTTQPDAAGKVGQLAVLLGPDANPAALPVFHYMPNVDPLSASAQSLRTAGSVGVYNDRAALVAAIHSLP